MLRDITIRPVLNGFIVSVGCQTVVFNELNTMCDELSKYYTDPNGCEKRYRKDAINAELLKDRPPAPPTPSDDRRQPETLGQLVNRLGQQQAPQYANTPCPPPSMPGSVPCGCEQSEAPEPMRPNR